MISGPFSNRFKVSASMCHLQSRLWKPDGRNPLPINRRNVSMAHERLSDSINAMVSIQVRIFREHSCKGLLLTIVSSVITSVIPLLVLCIKVGELTRITDWK